jgi:hypothetical protein
VGLGAGTGLAGIFIILAESGIEENRVFNKGIWRFVRLMDIFYPSG